MSRLLMIQIVLTLALALCAAAMGMQIFGWGRIDPDALLPWAYGAAASWCGMLVCMVARLCVWFRRWMASRESMKE